MIERAGLIGLGLIGAQRYSALRRLDIDVVGIVDPAAEGRPVDVEPSLLVDFEEMLGRSPDLVIVSTPHDVAAQVLPQVLAAGPTVLVEKPLGRSAREASALQECQVRTDQLWVGFNYRFMPGVAALLRDVNAGMFGDVISASLTIGHGGSPADQGSWKLDPKSAGGGCLIDPGVHALDLALQIAGSEVDVVGGTTWRGFWGTGIEEECRMLLDARGVSMMLDLSVVRWRSTFRAQVNGTEGYGIVTGRGRTYGAQTYRRGRRWGWQSGASQEESEEPVVTSDCTESFVDELRSLGGSDSGGARVCDAASGVRIMELLDRCREVLHLPVSR